MFVLLDPFAMKFKHTTLNHIIFLPSHSNALSRLHRLRIATIGVSNPRNQTYLLEMISNKVEDILREHLQR